MAVTPCRSLTHQCDVSLDGMMGRELLISSVIAIAAVLVMVFAVTYRAVEHIIDTGGEDHMSTYLYHCQYASNVQ